MFWRFVEKLSKVGLFLGAAALCVGGCERDRILKVNIEDPARSIKVDVKGAIEKLERKRELDPSDHENLWWLAYAYEKTEQWGKMAATLRDAAELKPDFAHYWKGYGEALVELGQLGDRTKYEAAKVPLTECVNRDPNFAECYHYLGLAHEGLGELRQALESYDRAIEVDPSQGEFYLPPAQLYVALKRYDEARSVLTEAVRRLPKLVMNQEDLVEVHLLLSDIAFARADTVVWVGELESAHELSHSHPQASLRLARAYRQLSPPKAQKAAEVLATFRQDHCQRPSDRYSQPCGEAKAILAELRAH